MDAQEKPSLLPQPRTYERLAGCCLLNSGPRLRLDLADDRVRAAAERVISQWPSTTSGQAVELHIATDRAVVHSDGYRLHVEPARIGLLGGSAAGCFYGLQTFAQLAAEEGRQDASGATLQGIACCHIEDQPSFAVRGLLHDVTRGKVPKLSTLKLLADRLARLKCNQLHLYIEHAFAFSFDPEICGPEDGLTPDEVRELDAYCRARFIDLVPAVATLGHMGRILSTPRYRHLAEIELTTSWEQMTWLQRLKGATLDVLNPESRRLVERIWTEIFAAFSSPVVNICGDEPWDLGKGKNARLSPAEAAEAYVDHLRWTAELAARHGRTCQIWGDVIRNHTNLLTRLPPDMTILHWGYDDRTDYEGTAAFTRAGYPTCVCPGTSGWKRILNAMDLAERNIATFARAGAAHGAIGLVNTDWGDFGHFNQLACSWHGIALGAAFAWNAEHPSGAEFDRLFARHVLRCPPELITHLRVVSAIAEKCETWRALIIPLEELTASTPLPPPDLLAQAATSAANAKCILGSLVRSEQNSDLRNDFCELRAACLFTRVLADRLQPAHGDRASSNCRSYVEDATQQYSDYWLRRNKETGLRRVMQAIQPACATHGTVLNQTQRIAN